MTKKPLVLSLDQGTSSSRAAIFDSSGDLVASASAPLSIEYPSDGWVQQNPMDIWVSQHQAMANLEKKLSPEEIKSVVTCGITNQRETTILWRKSSGQPCGPALVWQDGRTTNICAKWKEQGLEEQWRQKTGLLLDPYFSASKVQWLLENSQEARKALQTNDLFFGTVDSWLLWNLTNGKNHSTDMSNASRTLLMDLEKLEWLDEFCEVIRLPKNALPELKPCRGNFGKIHSGIPFAGTPIQALLGDQQAATLGQLCLKPGTAKCTYGTGAFLVINSGDKIYRSNQGLLSTLGWTDEKGKPTYCLEGSLFNAGTVIQWLRDDLRIIESANEINSLAEKATGRSALMLVPAFTGWGTPHWDPNARGLMIGLTRDTKREHLARAALEGIALSVATLISIAEKEMGNNLKDLAVDGGAAASDPLLQAQADSTGLKIKRPKNLESTARGVALLAGVQANVFDDFSQLSIKAEGTLDFFQPKMSTEERKTWLAKWDQAVLRSLNWHE